MIELGKELNMLQTKNPGVLEAISEVRKMNLGKGLRALYEAHLKEVRKWHKAAAAFFKGFARDQRKFHRWMDWLPRIFR